MGRGGRWRIGGRSAADTWPWLVIGATVQPSVDTKGAAVAMSGSWRRGAALNLMVMGLLLALPGWAGAYVLQVIILQTPMTTVITMTMSIVEGTGSGCSAQLLSESFS